MVENRLVIVLVISLSSLGFDSKVLLKAWGMPELMDNSLREFSMSCNHRGVAVIPFFLTAFQKKRNDALKPNEFVERGQVTTLSTELTELSPGPLLKSVCWR